MCILAGWPVAAATTNLDSLLHAVEKHYNSAQSLTLSFTESYKTPKRSAQVESGSLSLRKPGKMRWDYTSPSGKLFVSDGKDVYLFLPDANRVEHSKFKESEDLRAPLAFLLGKLNFYKEFRKFDLRPEGEENWVIAEPSSQNLPYTRVEFRIGPDARILQLKVIGQDGSVMDFSFTQERLNVPLSAKLFSFQTPAGAQVVEGEQ